MQNQHFRVFLMLPSGALEHLGGHYGWPNRLTTQVLRLEDIDLEMFPESLKWFIPHQIPTPACLSVTSWFVPIPDDGPTTRSG